MEDGKPCLPCCPIEKENPEDFIFVKPPPLNAAEWLFTPKPRILGRPESCLYLLGLSYALSNFEGPFG